MHNGSQVALFVLLLQSTILGHAFVGADVGKDVVVRGVGRDVGRAVGGAVGRAVGRARGAAVMRQLPIFFEHFMPPLPMPIPMLMPFILKTRPFSRSSSVVVRPWPAAKQPLLRVLSAVPSPSGLARLCAACTTSRARGLARVARTSKERERCMIAGMYMIYLAPFPLL
jgi:hypothetical protein